MSVIEYLEIGDFKLVPLEQLKAGKKKPVFILCQNSLLNCPYIDINKFMINKLSDYENQIIKQSALWFRNTRQGVGYTHS